MQRKIKWWAHWGAQRQAVAPTLLYSRIVLDPEQAGFGGFGMLQWTQWTQWMQWVLSEALIWCFHLHYAGPTLDAMLFVYGNGACVRDFACLGSDFFSYFTLDPIYVPRFEVGYMVFIGDFVPPILAVLFPEEEWAKETQGSLAIWQWKFWNQQRCKPTEMRWKFEVRAAHVLSSSQQCGALKEYLNISFHLSDPIRLAKSIKVAPCVKILSKFQARLSWCQWCSQVICEVLSISNLRSLFWRLCPWSFGYFGMSDVLRSKLKFLQPVSIMALV